MSIADPPAPPVSETSQLPPAPTTTARSAEGFEILVFRAGPPPYAWAQPGLVASSFVSETDRKLSVVALARLKGHPEEGASVRWRVTPPAGFAVAEEAVLTGPELHLELTREAGNPGGMGAALSLSVTAELKSDKGRWEAGRTLSQDLPDRLRQEYVDLNRGCVPERAELVDEKQFVERYGEKYPTVTFAELNFSRIPGSEERYPVILAEERLVAAVHETELAYGRPVVVSSGFRNPVRQEVVHGSVDESHHQYGRAADLYVAPDSAPPSTGRTTSSEGDWLRLAAAAIRGGGIWVEPMLQCHVNTAGCHVHVDVREPGLQSRVIRIYGLISDPAGGPVEGAEVRLAGMPAVTNAEGRFVLKHVVVPGVLPLEITRPGAATAIETISVGESETIVALTLSADTQETLASYRAPEPVLREVPPHGETVPTPNRTAAELESPQTGSLDPGALAGGMAVGGMAAAVHSAAKRRTRKPASAPIRLPSGVEASTLPGDVKTPAKTDSESK